MFWLPLCYQLNFSSYSFLRHSKLCTIWQGNVQWNSSSSRCNIFSHLLLLPPKTFFNMGFATLPRNGAAAEARSPIRNRLSLCFLYILLHHFYLFSSNVPDTLFYIWFSSYSHKSLPV